MFIYLDNCALQRPIDKPVNLRIRVEAEAVLGILELIENGEIILVSSTLLEFELSKTPSINRVHFASQILQKAKKVISLTPAMVEEANKYVASGLKPIDALHLAIASIEKIDYLCTCDDRFYKACGRLSGLAVKVMMPLELIDHLAL